MAHDNGVLIEKLQGGLGRFATGTDDHVAIIVTGLPVGAVATAVSNSGKGIALTSVYAAEQIGLTASFDANNGLNIHDDIQEFFRLAPEGTLYVYDSLDADDLKTFISQNKEIKGYGFSITYNEEAPNLVTTINAHQAIINALAENNRLIDFAVIGPNSLSTFTQDLFALNAPNVAVTIACKGDQSVVSIGAALGMLAVRKINENMGSVNIIKKPLAKRGFPDYSLTDSTVGAWPDAYLTTGISVTALEQPSFQELKGKGYIMAASYEGYPGFFFTDSCTCIARESDFAYIENNRTWNKAARIIRVTLLPEVKGVVKKDPTTGFIANTTVAKWESLLNKALERMVSDDEISGFKATIDPRQVVNSTSPVNVKAQIVADGIVHEFNVAIGLTNSI